MRQNAARHAGAMPVLAAVIKSHDAEPELFEIAIAAIRNLCGNSAENAEVSVSVCVCVVCLCQCLCQCLCL
jgi:hypothetical protein